jgi:hypothetical protein
MNPIPLDELWYAIIMITPGRIMVFALGQEQLYRRSVFGQG